MPRSSCPCLDEGYCHAPAKRLLSDPNRGFPFGPGNRRTAPGAVVRESAVYRLGGFGRSLSSLGDIAGRTEQPRRTRTAPPAQPVASALHPTVVVHGNGWVDEGRCATAEQRQCTVFARANKPAEANDIGGQGRREFSPLGQRCRNDSRIAPLAEGRTVAFTSP
jgi:hypothetical protein